MQGKRKKKGVKLTFISLLSKLLSFPSFLSLGLGLRGGEKGRNLIFLGEVIQKD